LALLRLNLSRLLLLADSSFLGSTSIMRVRPRRHSILSMIYLVVAGVAPCVALLGCTGMNCSRREATSVNDVLYFGTDRGSNRAVTEDDWDEFVSTSVTPRFPDGLTFWRASGQWLRDDRRLVHESSWILNIVHAPTEQDERRLEQIAHEYAVRFEQKAVFRARTAACSTDMN
jgi:hypothetical protein